MLSPRNKTWGLRAKWAVTERWAKTCPEYFWGSINDPRFEICRSLTSLPQVRTLSIGCGIGIVESFIPTNVDSVGVDEDIEKLRVAVRLNPWMAAIQANGMRLPFKDESFMNILLISVIEFVPDRNKFMDEVWRIMVPEAIGFTITPNRDSEVFAGNMGKLDREEFKESLKRFEYTPIYYSMKDEAIDYWQAASFRKVKK